MSTQQRVPFPFIISLVIGGWKHEFVSIVIRRQIFDIVHVHNVFCQHTQYRIMNFIFSQDIDILRVFDLFIHTTIKIQNKP